jgi:hypothetical protein
LEEEHVAGEGAEEEEGMRGDEEDRDRGNNESECVRVDNEEQEHGDESGAICTAARAAVV